MNYRGHGVSGAVADQSARTERRLCCEDQCQVIWVVVVPRIRCLLELISISCLLERSNPVSPFSPHPESFYGGWGGGLSWTRR